MPITINGTGSVTGLSAGGLPDGTVLQGDLAPNVAGNGPAFSAYQSTSQSIPDGIYTKVSFQAEEFDTGNYFDSAINYRFTPQVAGYYQVNAQTMLITSSSRVIIVLHKNGSEFKRGLDAAAQGASVSSLIYMNGTTDYLECWLYQSSGAAKMLAGGAAAYNYFQAFLARAT